LTRVNDDEVAAALLHVLKSPNEADSNGETANVVDGLFAIARSISSIALQLKYLGVGDAATTMGAIEFLAVAIKQGSENVACALERVADAIDQKS
jgi:hypothetical protein